MTDLLPCPKCGGLDMKLYITGGRAAFGCGEYDAEIECPCGIAFYTELCCETPEEAEAGAIATWNTRYHFGLTDEDYNILLDEMGIAKPERTCRNNAPVYLDFLCSECGFVHYHSEVNDTGDGNRWNYCPNCGSRVLGES